MSRTNTSYFCTICMLAACMSMPGHAIGFSFGNNKMSMTDPNIMGGRPWGNFDATKPAPQYQPPQPPPGNYYMGTMPEYMGGVPEYRGGMPGGNWYPGQMPEYAPAGNGQPVVEVELDGSVFYQQQNLIYTVRVVSDGNIETLKAELPRIDGAVLEHLKGPVVGTRNDGRTNRQQIINTYHYKLMPLRAGEVDIPPIRFTGTLAQDRQMRRGRAMPAREFSIAAAEDLTIRVQPAEPDVNPWLPLQDLKLSTNLEHEGPATAGKPVTLTVELKAKGALGNQLPSVAGQLESASYRIYRDATTVQNGISSDGRYLTGIRKETYTIIPLEDGWIRLPAVSVAWWDVDSDTARHAGLPHGSNDAATAGGGAVAGSRANESPFSFWFWIPMIITLSLIAGFWLGSWHRTRPLVKSAAGWLTVQGQHAMQFAQHAGTRLSLMSHLKRLYMGFALLMPKSIRVWMCARCLLSEDDPEAWCTEFRGRVCRHLDIASRAPLTHVAEKIIEANPHATPARLRSLSRSLDKAIYGGTALDFPAWKRDFMQELRPRPLNWRRVRTRRGETRLPALNPRSAA